VQPLEACNALSIEPWTLVDAAWTSSGQHAATHDNRTSRIAG